jgi:hypothetical protein
MSSSNAPQKLDARYGTAQVELWILHGKAHVELAAHNHGGGRRTGSIAFNPQQLAPLIEALTDMQQRLQLLGYIPRKSAVVRTGLASPVRQQADAEILRLSQEGCSVTDIATRLNMNKGTVSRRLRALQAAVAPTLQPKQLQLTETNSASGVREGREDSFPNG